ncbi:hypothetical protein PRZ48_003267 [Zasmidium cellare]|uniref:Uncharacterized protein n=1 Tax=Zasmidium cellare TaxID=395010 RepID=A0ABR0EV80_ZASCE|nr:hypothetical protein PRZ48_003267 [Zasmidium cellare]
MSFTSDTASSSNDDEGVARRVPEPLDVDMPTEAKSITTIAYQQALKNRLIEQLLSDGERFDANAYTPTFLHDILMLPGSLANLLDKVPTWNITHQMTPALLPGYKAHIHTPTLQPALLPCNTPNAHVQGMLVFGLSKPLRRLIHAHYRPHAKRRKLTLEVELQVLVEEDGPGHVWPIKVFRPRRRAVEAHVWVWSRKRGGEDFYGEQEWRLEEALAGNLGAKQTMLRVEGDGKGDEDGDGWIGREVREVRIDDGEEGEGRRRRRSVGFGGATGSLDYGRVEGVEFTGW